MQPDQTTSPAAAAPTDSATHPSSPKEETMQSNTTEGSTASTPGSTAAPSSGGTTASSDGSTTASSDKATRARSELFDTKRIEKDAAKVIVQAKDSSDPVIIGDVQRVQATVAGAKGASGAVIAAVMQFMAAGAAWLPAERDVGDALAPIRALLLRTEAGRDFYAEFSAHDTWRIANEVLAYIGTGSFEIPTVLMTSLEAAVQQAQPTYSKLAPAKQARIDAIANYKKAKTQVRAAVSVLRHGLQRGKATVKLQPVAAEKKAEQPAANGHASNGASHVVQKPAA